jgi:hypothetical protein
MRAVHPVSWRQRLLGSGGLGVLVAAAGLLAGCLPRDVAAPGDPPAPDVLAELWFEPEPGRDLFHGVGGARLAPDPGAIYRVIEVKVGGFSDGYDVVGPDDREWATKFPPEAPTEVVASRIHWGIGYHQPPIYFVHEWRAEGAITPNPQLPSRFREDEPDLHGLEDEGDWSFYDNPFLGTRQLAGLLVLQALLGNSDLKDSNNSLFELDAPFEGATRWYVTRDVGQTFGRTGALDAPRGDVEVFEQTPFINSVDGDHVLLEYRGQHGVLFEGITVDDVRWLCGRLDALSDEQWADAFRAGGYEPGVASRFIQSLKRKIAQGLALESRAVPATPDRRE